MFGPANPISVHNTEWDSSPATIIRYRDNGPGLSGAVRARIFEAFFTTKDTGTGLGMAIAKRIVDEHGGELTVGSGDYSGAEFLIKLRRNFT